MGPRRNNLAHRYLCHAGLWNYCFPLCVDGNVVGFFFAGQFRCQLDGKSSPVDFEQYQTLELAWEKEERSRVIHSPDKTPGGVTTQGGPSEEPQNGLPSQEDLRAAFRTVPLLSEQKAEKIWEKIHQDRSHH